MNAIKMSLCARSYKVIHIFREAAFLDRATIIYLAIARARQEQEMHAINLLAGPALAQTLETEMQNLRTHHRTFRIAGL